MHRLNNVLVRLLLLSCNYSNWVCVDVMPDFSGATRQLNLIGVFGQIMVSSNPSARDYKNYLLVEKACSRSSELPPGQGGLLKVISKLPPGGDVMLEVIKISIWLRWSAKPFLIFTWRRSWLPYLISQTVTIFFLNHHFVNVEHFLSYATIRWTCKINVEQIQKW